MIKRPINIAGKAHTTNRNVLNKVLNHENLFRLLGKRTATIKTCFQILASRENELSILEIGATRSFTSGTINTHEFDPDPEAWDWGAGCFTAAIKILFPDCKLTSVDPNPEAIKVSKIILRSLGAEASFKQTNSTDFLNKTADKYDLIYMDHAESGGNDSCAVLHRNDAALILNKNLVKPDGLILIDDIQTVFNKGMYSIPFLEEQGLTHLSKNSYQALFRKD